MVVDGDVQSLRNGSERNTFLAPELGSIDELPVRREEVATLKDNEGEGILGEEGTENVSIETSSGSEHEILELLLFMGEAKFEGVQKGLSVIHKRGYILERMDTTDNTNFVGTGDGMNDPVTPDRKNVEEGRNHSFFQDDSNACRRIVGISVLQ